MSNQQAVRNGTARNLPPVQQNAIDQNLSIDQRLHEEMKRLAAVNRELLQQVRGQRAEPEPAERKLAGHNSAEREQPKAVAAVTAQPAAINGTAAALAEALPGGDSGAETVNYSDEVAVLRTENAQLRTRLDEMEQVLGLAAEEEQTAVQRHKEYEAILEEKSEVIRALHLKLQEAQASSEAQQAPAAPGSQAEADRLSKELAQLRKQLEDERRQLGEDEESLMAQMRQMEMAMSKDRAELARQRNEIQRLNAELNREIENAARDPGLREKLLSLQRRQQAILGGSGSRQLPTQNPVNGTAHKPQAAQKQSSGLLRRLFGQ